MQPQQTIKNQMKQQNAKYWSSQFPNSFRTTTPMKILRPTPSAKNDYGDPLFINLSGEADLTRFSDRDSTVPWKTLFHC